MNHYQYIFFDLDGTVTDSQEGITKCVDHALRTVLNLQTKDLSTLTCYIGPPLVDGFMENHHLDHETAVRCKDIYRERYETVGLFENRIYPGIPETLKRLQDAGYILVLATSKPEVFARRILDHFHLTQYFEEICGATLDGRINQKDEVIQEALRRLDHPSPNEILMIGDRHHDVLGAKKYGIRTLGVLFGFGSEAELREAGAYAIAETPEAICDFIFS